MNAGRVGGRRIFISHSSTDQDFATWLSVDPANESHEPWLDEWEIRAGGSIPRKIALRTKKYADFRVEYRDGLERVLDAVGQRHS